MKTINVLAIDVAKPGFNIGLVAMNALTGGQAVHLGKVEATVKQVSASICGLKVRICVAAYTQKLKFLPVTWSGHVFYCLLLLCE